LAVDRGVSKAAYIPSGGDDDDKYHIDASLIVPCSLAFFIR